MGVNASFAQSTCPVAPSMRSACSAVVLMMAKAGVARSATTKARAPASLRCMGLGSGIVLLVNDDSRVIAAEIHQCRQHPVCSVELIERSGADAIELLTIALNRGNYKAIAEPRLNSARVAIDTEGSNLHVEMRNLRHRDLGDLPRGLVGCNQV